MKILRKNEKEIIAIDNTVTEKKSAFDGLSSRLDTAEQSFSELEDVSIEKLPTEKIKRKTPHIQEL